VTVAVAARSVALPDQRFVLDQRLGKFVELGALPGQ
jgi:hypothetical protein